MPRLPIRRVAMHTLLLSVAAGGLAADVDEFRIKREQVFAFAEKPALRRDGDRVTIRFASKGYCDVTVAIEDADGRILRHLASGVLGPNAPEPLQKDSLSQTILWDGKDDLGQYLEGRDRCIVRVSLGLKPLFERTLLWHPARRIGGQCPRIAAAEDGVYVYHGEVVDSVRVFDHRGNYLRTVYPFPRDALERVQGLHIGTFPQDGARLPLKEGFHQATLLSCGANGGFDKVGVDKHNNWDGPVSGNAATAIAVRAGRIALAQLSVDRLATDGTTGGLPLHGPDVTFPITLSGNYRYDGRTTAPVCPTSAAFSPDGRTLYLAGYLSRHVFFWDGLHGVVKLAFDDPAAKPELFAGSMDQRQSGRDNAHFRCATSVACDPQGRFYIADYMNDRVQVFSPGGQFLKTIPAARPAMIQVHQRTGHLYVFSWLVQNRILQEELEAARKAARSGGGPEKRAEEYIKPTMTHFGPFDDPKAIGTYNLPVYISRGAFGYLKFPPPGLVFLWAELDSWSDPPTIWFGMFRGQTGEIGIPAGDGGLSGDPWERTGIVLLTEDAKAGRLAVTRDLGAEVKAAVGRAAPTTMGRSRLAVNPADGRLYVLEGDGAVFKSVLQCLRADPDTGRAVTFDFPYDCEDLAFDIEGMAYLRAFTAVGRFDPATWREIPWDYGEQRGAVNMNNEGGRKKRAPLTAGLIVPVGRYNHQGGLYVAPTGHIAVCSYMEYDPAKTRNEYAVAQPAGKPYSVQLYPGRKTFALVNVWDRHGRLVRDDAVQGMAFTNGIGLDSRDNIYLMPSAARVLDGTPYFNPQTGTLIKFPPTGGRILATHKSVQVQLAREDWPPRPPDLQAHGGGRLGNAWVEGAQWFYGGVGYHGRSQVSPGYGCDCWNSRFALDYFARSFVPEVDHYSVAVLDSSGNLILRVGRYGNVDDGTPLVRDGGPAATHAIGGDEVALFHAAYVGTHTDRRLFIADAGNGRIVSVRLGYHAQEKVPLGGAPDTAGGERHGSP